MDVTSRSGCSAPPVSVESLLKQMGYADEASWVHAGDLCSSADQQDRALSCYMNALYQNPSSQKALSQLAAIFASRNQFKEAIELNQRLLNIRNDNGTAWTSLAQCYMDSGEMQRAYVAFQQALITAQSSKDPSIWFGIGVMYERCRSLENAEAAYVNVLRVSPDFSRKQEVLFRLACVMKARGKLDEALIYYKRVALDPPVSVKAEDILFQCALIYEEKGEFSLARDMYRQVLKEENVTSMVLQSFGRMTFCWDPSNVDESIGILLLSLKCKNNDAFTYYLLARCYLAQKNYKEAHNNFKKAICYDPSNPFFWCSCGILFVNLGQYGDAIDAFARVIRTVQLHRRSQDTTELRMIESAAWYNIGSLYYWCNQMTDSLQAYMTAYKTDPTNALAQKRVEKLSLLPPNSEERHAVEGQQPTLAEDGISLIIDSALVINSPVLNYYKKQLEEEGKLFGAKADVPTPSSQPRSTEEKQGRKRSRGKMVQSSEAAPSDEQRPSSSQKNRSPSERQQKRRKRYSASENEDVSSTYSSQPSSQLCQQPPPQQQQQSAELVSESKPAEHQEQKHVDPSPLDIQQQKLIKEMQLRIDKLQKQAQSRLSQGSNQKQPQRTKKQ